ncbi:winged helix-turn-helix domain-containing protein [Candidatus Pacearchaeota archaeon]|nr:winged helix-turn-helix domain-containing protein [Candidatus Pacearchaeota archaeon]
MSEKEIKEIMSLLYDDATIYGFENPLWNCKMVQQIILKRIGKKIHTTNIMRLFKKLNLSPQKPERLASQRNEKAIRKWKREEWPKIVDPEELIKVITKPDKILASDRDDSVAWYFLYSKQRKEYLKVSAKYYS